MDQYGMQQRGRRTSEQPIVRITDEEEYLDDEYGNEWSPRTHRYQGLADVKSEVGRKRADVQPLPRRSGADVDYQASIPARRGATQTNIPVVPTGRQRPVRTDEVLVRRGRGPGAGGFRPHWLFYVGVALLVMLLGWMALTAFLGWWQVTQDDWHYGRPRTYQVDMAVGHNDSPASPSHFIAINLNRRIEIIEFPGGDPSKAKIYMGPILIGANQDLTVVTLTFKDVNGDGKLDMIVNVQDSRFVFINENSGFRAAHPNEHLQL